MSPGPVMVAAGCGGTGRELAAYCGPDGLAANRILDAAYRADRLSWLRALFDSSNAEYDRLDLDRDDPVGALSTEFDQGLHGLEARTVRSRLTRIERLVTELGKGRKLYGPLYDDLLKLKYLHQRYTNYLAWLETR